MKACIAKLNQTSSSNNKRHVLSRSKTSKLCFESGLKVLFLSLFLLPNLRLQAQSFEGNMTGKIAGKDVSLYIWLAIEMPKDNGIVKGSYFYKTVGKEISISGNKKESQISLFEKDKNQKTTGIFSLKILDGILKGFWYNLNNKDTLQVELYRTNPSFRNTARIPKLKDLLAEDIEFYSAGLENNKDSEQGVNYAVVFAGSNLLSVKLNWENWGYTAHYGTIHHTYNLATREMINLKDEITDSCYSYLCWKLTDMVTSHRSDYEDSEWMDGLYSYMNDTTQKREKLNDLFTVSALPGKAELYLSNGNLTCYIQDYCEQYFSSGNRAMTFDCTIDIPFCDLKPMIKKESVLQNLFYP